MSRPLYIKEATVRRALSVRKAFNLAEQTFRLLASGTVQMPPKLYLSLPGITRNDFRAMPAYIGTRTHAVAGLKWVNVFPENRRLGLPTVDAHILLNDARTGVLLAILEARTITALRTAAAAAVATKYMANPRPKILALVGAGLQARYQLRALTDRYRFSDVRVWGAYPDEARRFISQFKQSPCRFRASTDVRSCVDGADIVTTCTPSRKPLVMAGWIKPGAHINAIGADAKGKQELDPKLLLGSRVVVDETAQAWHSGEINVPVARGLFRRSNIHGQLCEIVAGHKKGRGSKDQITVFDSTGLAVLDLMFARHLTFLN